ncbi:unnamed protein product [Rotaria sordida]|uniref:Uncharacterized protein n=1 Tax=Rotaria sordida TaxID=392033 RepID=A0A813N0T3_9BILA|nr:unnamed protein product [Rotaria sordida]
MLEWLKNLLDGRVSDIKKPFGGTFIGISIIQNWKALYALAFGGNDNAVEDRISIASNYTSEHLLWPSILALFLIFIYPTLDSVASAINLFVKLKIKPTLLSIISPRNLVPKDHYLTLKKNLENVQKKNNELQDDINTLNSTKFSLNEELRKQQILIDEKRDLVFRNIQMDIRVGVIVHIVHELNILTAKSIDTATYFESAKQTEIKIFKSLKGQNPVEINSNNQNTFYLGSELLQFSSDISDKIRFWDTISEDSKLNPRWIEIKEREKLNGYLDNCNWVTDSFPLHIDEALSGGKYYLFTWFILEDTTILDDSTLFIIADDKVNIYLNYLGKPLISSEAGLDKLEIINIDKNKFVAGLNYVVFEVTNIESVAKENENGYHNPYGIIYKLILRFK